MGITIHSGIKQVRERLFAVPTPLPDAFSIHLDLVRFSAALAVFVAHLASVPITRGSVWPPLGQYGSAAVTLFFVLSGYVISYTTSFQEREAKSYVISRISRLYSVVLIALPLTFLLDSLGLALNPPFYQDPRILLKPASLAGYLSSLFFLNEYQVFGFGGISPGSNGPYWSMSFEASYYLIAGILLFCRRPLAIAVSLIVLALAGRTIAALLPLWALGFALQRLRIPSLRPGLWWLAFWASALLLVFSPSIDAFIPHLGARLFLPWGRGPFNRDITSDYFVALSFAIHLVSARALLADGCRPLERLEAPIRWLGSLTFPLYLFHYPALCLFAAICPWGDASPARLAFLAALSAALVIALAPICDALKRAIRKVLPSASLRIRSFLARAAR